MPVKEKRLEARVTSEQKNMFQRAAAIKGQSLTEFVITTLQERASQVVKEHDIIVLSDKDREVFFDALLNPPEPNEKLREAVRKKQEILG